MNQQRLKLKPKRKPKNFWRNLAQRLERTLILERAAHAETMMRLGLDVRLAG
jgi:hypothetical protein